MTVGGNGISPGGIRLRSAALVYQMGVSAEAIGVASICGVAQNPALPKNIPRGREIPRGLLKGGYVVSAFKSLSLLRDLVERRLSDSIASFLEILQRIDKELPPDLAILFALDGLDGDVLNGRAFPSFVRRLSEPETSGFKLLATSFSSSIPPLSRENIHDCQSRPV